MDEQLRDQTADSGHPVGPAGTVSAREAAATLGLNERTIRRAIARGALPAAKLRGVYQIEAADLARYRAHLRLMPSTAVTARSATPRLIRFPGWRHAELSQPLTPLIGRDRETAEVVNLLRSPDIRLIVLTGPGGVGKTRLALRAAVEASDAYPDGTWFVGLGSIADPALVPPTILRAFDLRETESGSEAEQLARLLGRRGILLVLDNFEQVTPAAPFVADILERCPRLTVLVTSRTVLGLYGEHTFVVPPLVESEAVELFIGRAEAAGAAVSISAESRHVLGTICNRLDRLPLAIELAAARSRVLPPPTLLDRLDRRLPLLAGGGVNQPARLRSMRDAISWSYDLLPTTIQAVVRQLAVFSSGFSLEAAEVVSGSDIVMDGITSLLDASLLNEIGTSDGRMRFAMLETVREFALERLVAAGGEPTARGRHAGWCLGLAERAATELIGPHERVWLERLAIEHENVRAALNWLLTIGDAETSLRIGAGLYQYWFVRGHVGEGRSWLERALALPQARHIPSPVRTRALYATAMLCSRQRDGVEAVRLAEECLALASATSDDLGVAYALKVLGMDAVARGDHDHARTFLDAAIPLFHTAGDEHAKAIVLMHRGMIANAPDADGYLTEAIATFNAIGHTGGGSAMAIARLGQVARALGNRTRAAELFHEAVERAWDARDVWALPNALECVATVANRERAAKLCGAAEALRETTSTTGRSIARPEHLQALEEVHSWRSSPNIAAAWASGRELSPGEAVAEALSPPSTDSRITDAPDDLTPREREVLRLLAEGLTDAEMASVLFISPHTVTTHVKRILAKLAVGSRAAAVSVAFRRGLV